MLSRNSNPMLLSKKRAVILETFFVYFTQDKRLEMCHTCKGGGRRTADPAESKLKTFCYDTNGAYQHIVAQFICCSHCQNRAALCRVGNCSSREPPEPLTIESGRVILGFDFRANRVNQIIFESKSSQS